MSDFTSQKFDSVKVPVCVKCECLINRSTSNPVKSHCNSDMLVFRTKCVKSCFFFLQHRVQGHTGMWAGSNQTFYLVGDLLLSPKSPTYTDLTD